MTAIRSFLESWWSELPRTSAARWAALFFSLHVLTQLISVAASQAFLAAATVAFFAHLLQAARASRPRGRERPAPARGQDALATAGETPALLAFDFPPVKLPLAVYCLATINSVLWAEHPEAGGFALRKLVLFLILLLAVNLVVSRRHLSSLLQGIFFVAAVAGLVGIAQFIIQYDRVLRYHHNRVYFYMTLTRTHGFMGHWMNFGGQQMMVFSALLAFVLLSGAVIGPPPQREEGLGGGGYQDRHSINHPLTPSLTRRGITRWLYWLILAVVAISLVLNFTRGVWLGCLVAALYVLARWKPRTLWAVPLLLLVVALAGPSLIRRRVSMAFHPKEDPALAIRLEMWHTGLRMARAHPWVGVGPDNIPLVYMRYLPPGANPIFGYHDHLHDNALQMAAERGLPCLIAWLWFMLALGWHILRIRRRLSSGRWVADAAFAAWLAFVAEGFFEFNFGTTPVLMVFLFVMSTPFIAERLEKVADTDR
ncbi:MAG: O-antigen ligase family protein [Terriglobia bacterium]|jgi:O-antigen ligase